jgi:hypothetical protein
MRNASISNVPPRPNTEKTRTEAPSRTAYLSLNLILWLNVLPMSLLDLNFIPLHSLKAPQINWHALFPCLLVPLAIFRKVFRRNGESTDVDADATDRAELMGLHGSAENVGCCWGSRMDRDLVRGRVG